VTSLPSSLLPLGLFASLILPQVWGRAITKEARIRSLEVLPECCKISALEEREQEEAGMKTTLAQELFL